MLLGTQCIKLRFITSVSKREGLSHIRVQLLDVIEVNWHQFKLDFYNFKMLYIILLVTKKKISVEYTQRK